MYRRIATAIIARLNAVRQETPLMKSAGLDAEALYHWAARFPGGGLADIAGESSFIAQLVKRKRDNGLL